MLLAGTLKLFQGEEGMQWTDFPVYRKCIRSGGFFNGLVSVAIFPVQGPPSPVIWMASRMHHGNDLDESIFHPVDQSVREAMDKVSPDTAVFVYKWPVPG